MAMQRHERTRLARTRTVNGAHQQENSVRRVTRRDLLTYMLAVPVLVACGRTGNDAGAQTAGAQANAWSLEDDRGVTVSLPARPTRIVAHIGSAAALWDLGIKVVGTFGPRAHPNGKRNELAGDVDLEATPSVGDVYGELDIEKLASLKPDLIVSTAYQGGDLWYIVPDVAARVERVAPTFGVMVASVPITEPISKFERLAEALGADLKAAPIIEANQRFEQASTAVKTVATERAGMKVLVVGGTPTMLYVKKPASASDLIYFQQLGVDLVVPEGSDVFWEALSWEQAAKYSADLILKDARPQALTMEQLAAIPTWNEQPAVKAGQVGMWRAEAAYSRKGFAAILEELAETMRRSRADVV